MLKSELKPTDYASYYGGYLEQLPENAELLDTLSEGIKDFTSLLKIIPEAKLHYAYDADKWTVAEALLHIIDTERIFQYRALRFGRNDTTPIVGFEQDDYVPTSDAANRSNESLLMEFIAVRKASLTLFATFSQERLQQLGTASGAKMSVGALGFMVCAHQKHHANIIRERYL